MGDVYARKYMEVSEHSFILVDMPKANLTCINGSIK